MADERIYAISFDGGFAQERWSQRSKGVAMGEYTLTARADAARANSGPQMIDIGGRCLALTSAGAGSPSVILETGLGAESDEWALVQRETSAAARVVRYDRANRGASDGAAGPRTALDMVEDLHALVRAADIEGPHILVGHSFGGLLVRLYAQRYREEVAGIVLVDAMHEDQFDVFGPLFPPATHSDPPELQRVRAFWQEGWRSPATTTERIDFVSSIRSAREIKSLGDVPLHVIIAGTFLHQPLIPPQFRESLQKRWQAQQMQFLMLSTRATYSLALRSGHFVQRDAPRTICDAIKDTIAAASRPTAPSYEPWFRQERV
jgi:pimeloyl-ACP methyl ester carboxylesterase